MHVCVFPTYTAFTSAAYNVGCIDICTILRMHVYFTIENLEVLSMYQLRMQVYALELMHSRFYVHLLHITLATLISYWEESFLFFFFFNGHAVTYAHLHRRPHKYMHVCTNRFTHRHTCVHMLTYTRTCKRSFAHAYSHIQMHTLWNIILLLL